MYQDGKTEYIAKIIGGYGIPDLKRILVVGCGNGVEAAILAQELDAEAVGIDMADFAGRENLLQEYAKEGRVHLEEGDATRMRFEDASFDLVYSFHALEHIPEYEKALSEMNRVLKPGGGYWVGTPCRTRLFAYFGAKSGKLTFGRKIKLNLIDWKARLQGRFRNEYGAHAGFTRGELGSGRKRPSAIPRTPQPGTISPGTPASASRSNCSKPPGSAACSFPRSTSSGRKPTGRPVHPDGSSPTALIPRGSTGRWLRSPYPCTHSTVGRRECDPVR